MNRSDSPLLQLIQHGQSYWLDNLTREKIQGGELERRVSEEGLRGITSNPSIFQKAISGSDAYRDQIREAAREGLGPYDIYERLVLTDIQDACDILRPVYDESEGADGFVSLELSPYLAHDTEGSIRDAQRLFEAVDRPNVLIKIPGTPAGAPAIEEALYQGVNVNVTLLFSIEAYESVAEAYLRALERRLDDGRSVHDVASVASFFISRIDVLVDEILGHRMTPGSPGDGGSAEDGSGGGTRPEELLGKAGIANAKLAYARFLEILDGDRWQRLEAAGARPQRMLWASTSTKDPLYRDVRYVEPLIGPHTVNTLPDATIDAFADHGTVADTVEEGMDDARRTLDGLAQVGIDFDAVTTQLMNEGVEKFVTPFDDLLATLAEERAAALKIPGGDRAAPGVDAVPDGVLDSLATRQVGRRLHAHDASLWTDDPDKAAEVRNRLGWLTAPDDFLERVEELTSFAAEVRDEAFEDVVLLGMGGSSLAADVSRRIFGRVDGWPRLHVLDDTAPEAVAALRDSVELEKTFFLVQSKSGTTAETLSLYRTFHAWLEERGARAGEHFAAVTDPGSPLAEEARENGFRRVFENPEDFGGRYSALSYFGLVPMALQGVDVERLLQGARHMAGGCQAGVPPAANPGVALGAALGGLARAGRDKVTFVPSERLSAFGAWAEQLLAESTGKDGTGLVPVDGEPLGTPGAYGDDRVFVRLATAGEGDDADRTFLDDLEEAGHPVIRLMLPDIQALGAEFYRWEVAVSVAGHVLGVDAFDQPNVEAAKERTRNLLSAATGSGGGRAAGGAGAGSTAPGDGASPLATGDHLALFGDVDAEGGDPRAVLQALLETAGPDSYVALLPYLHRTPDRIRRLQDLRKVLRARLGVATTLGFGPRYLHSTGQLHKGGPDSGIFLVLTADEGDDIPIPGAGYGFGTLHRAQALGDVEALRDAGRRVIRVHLEDGVEAGLEGLAELLEPAETLEPVGA
jgi:transaldolase/glucose-6-phosphate isomerase